MVLKVVELEGITRGVLPAFPSCESDGMTLRAWFAGQALAGLMSQPEIERRTVKEIVNVAFDAADAMLERMTHEE